MQRRYGITAQCRSIPLQRLDHVIMANHGQPWFDHGWQCYSRNSDTDHGQTMLTWSCSECVTLWVNHNFIPLTLTFWPGIMSVANNKFYSNGLYFIIIFLNFMVAWPWSKHCRPWSTMVKTLPDHGQPCSPPPQGCWFEGLNIRYLTMVWPCSSCRGHLSTFINMLEGNGMARSTMFLNVRFCQGNELITN